MSQKGALVGYAGLLLVTFVVGVSLLLMPRGAGTGPSRPARTLAAPEAQGSDERSEGRPATSLHDRSVVAHKPASGPEPVPTTPPPSEPAPPPVVDAGATEPPAEEPVAPVTDGMARLPGGSFLMGVSEDRVQEFVRLCLADNAETSCQKSLFEDQTPPHRIRVAAFHMDRHEVTNAEYASCVSSGVCEAAATAGHAQLGEARHPVVGVSWNDADTYCRSRGKRLPTAAEWEWAARYPDGRRYPWGDAPPSAARARYCGDSGEVAHFFADIAAYREASPTVPVDALSDGRSALGLVHMSGNAFEWTMDVYSRRAYRDCAEGACPSPADNGKYRIAKGGSYSAGAPFLDAGYMRKRLGSRQWKDVGFRCAAGGSLGGSISGDMIAVPAGVLSRGLDDAGLQERLDDCSRHERMRLCEAWYRFDDQRPAHVVELNAFEIMTTEVTVAKYREFLREKRRRKPKAFEGIPQGSDMPVVGVSQRDAAAYCDWRGMRLPTEAEWERAARGTSGRHWPWGSGAPTGGEAALCSGHCTSLSPDERILSSSVGPAPVGSHRRDRTPEGVYDMLGNVREWTSDNYVRNAYAKCDKRRKGCKDPKYRRHRKQFVTRGGSFMHGPSRGLTFRTPRVSPKSRQADLGFRCVRDAQ